MSLDAQGNLVIAYDHGTMTDSAPVAWQDIDGQRTFVQVSYVLLGNNEVGFALGDYDHSQQLVIDPTLTWNTFLGASGSDYAQAIAMDGSGNVYVAGYSDANWGTPVRAYTSGYDGFVAKLDSSGNLIWNTFLGGSGANEEANGVAVDSNGNVYVVGTSDATWGTPVQAYSTGNDAFVAQLNSSGSLTWNTFLGGSGADYGYGVAVDASGNVYATGVSTATWGTPVQAYTSGTDGFVAKLNNTGSRTWSTFLGGTGTDGCQGVAVDGSGNVYLAGYSSVTWGTPVRAFGGGSMDGFAARLTSSGGLSWNSFVGGSGTDYGQALALDSGGNVYLTGYSSTTWGSPVQTFGGGSYDTLTAKFDNSGSLLWNTFLGGTGTEVGYGIAVDGSGNSYVTGYSSATWGTPGRAYTSGNDAFVAGLDSSGSRTWNTFLGGSGTDYGYGVAVDGSGNSYVIGYSTATWGTPVQAYSGGSDAFVAMIAAECPIRLLSWTTRRTHRCLPQRRRRPTIRRPGNARFRPGGLRFALGTGG